LREDQHEQASLCDSAAPAAGRGLFRRYHATVAGPLAEFLTSRHSSISPSPDGVFQETGPAFSSKCCPSRRTRSLAPESNLYHFVFRSSLMASILGLPHVRLQLAAGDCFQMARGWDTPAAGSSRSSSEPTGRRVRARPEACNPLLPAGLYTAQNCLDQRTELGPRPRSQNSASASSIRAPLGGMTQLFCHREYPHGAGAPLCAE